jgi:hypothetical protein
MAYAWSHKLSRFWPEQTVYWQHSCKLLWSLTMSADTVNKTNHVKKIICFSLLLISIYAKAGSCSANGTGNWETPGTWSCGHVPGAGDNVTIGSGIVIAVNANNPANIGNLDILGTLQFTNGSKINLASASVVNIYSGGSITGGNGGAKLVFPSASYAGPFSTTGPFFFSNGGSGSGLLSLTLVSFYSSLQNQDVILYWKTENEENIKSFEIESGGNGNSDWQPLEIIPSMAGEGGGYSYRFIDHAKMNGDRYYRLKIISRDGKYAYSKVLLITSTQSETVSIAPTLVYGSMKVTLPASGPTQVSIYNTYGHLVKTLVTGIEAFDMDVSMLTRGEYFLQVSQGKNSFVAKFFKQ